jgi:RNA polymerase sigma-70 factor (ECF subfamily)
VSVPGDQAVWFKQEVHLHDGQLKSWLRGQFPAVRDVDDVVQESYLRVWKARATQPIESAKAFLFKVARHLALDLLRRDTRSPLTTVEDLAGLRVIDTAPDAAEALLTQDTLQHLADAVVALPTHYRNVIVLHKIQGLSQREVAAQLGLSERSVEKYCHRGMVRCEAWLRARGIEGFFFRP